MLQAYAKAVNVGVRHFQLHRTLEKHGSLIQFQRNRSTSAKTDPNENKFKTNFSISDEVLNGRPLYLDAQATTPMVRTMSATFERISDDFLQQKKLLIFHDRIQGCWT